MTRAAPARGIEAIWPQLVAAAHGGCRPPELSSLALADLERRLVQLYLDFLEPGADGGKVIAHLGQSLDGRIATASGHSSYVTCEANLVHMHRLRALADAVVVGGGTVAHDDPQLTVRHVQGPSPVRVVLDTDRRLDADRQVCRATPPPTIILCRRECLNGGLLGRARVLGLAAEAGCLAPADILRCLRAQGLRRIFVEGGGVTVSRFLEAGCLDRLQLCIAPVIIGSGREALRLSPILRMDQALRLQPEVLPMGRDWLFACRIDRSPLAGGLRQPEQVAVPDLDRRAAGRNPGRARL